MVPTMTTGGWYRYAVDCAIVGAYVIFLIAIVPFVANARVYRVLGYAHALAATYPFLRRALAAITGRESAQMEGAIEECRRGELMIDYAFGSLKAEETRAVQTARTEQREAQEEAPSETTILVIPGAAIAAPAQPRVVELVDDGEDKDGADEAVPAVKVEVAASAAKPRQISFADVEPSDDDAPAPPPPPIEINLMAARAVATRRAEAMGVAEK